MQGCTSLTAGLTLKGGPYILPRPALWVEIGMIRRAQTPQRCRVPPKTVLLLLTAAAQDKSIVQRSLVRQKGAVADGDLRRGGVWTCTQETFIAQWESYGQPISPI